MTLIDYAGLCEYWEDFPPEHELLRAFVGFKAKPKVADLGDLIAAFGGLSPPPR